MANVVVSALATWNGKALKKAKSDVSVFDKQLKSLGRTFGITFSAAAVVAFSKNAVKAFAADEVAAKSLALQLENTGNAFRVSEVENYIQGLEKTYAILTDLRKPFQTFLNLTRSVGLSQRTLEAALNISAGTGESLDTVVNALAAGIRGNTKAINNLNTGIDANIIKTGDMNKIMAALEERFKGQAAARLDTYAGKVDVLKKSADEASKSIGKSLVGALEILSKDNSVSELANDFENLGDNIAYAIIQMAKLLDKLSAVTSSASFKPALLLLGAAASAATGNPLPFVAAFGTVGAMGIGGALTSKRSLSSEENSTLAKARILNRRIESKIIALTNTTRKEEYDILKKKTALDKLKEKFDLERVGLTTALNQATDEEIKTRIRAKITILDQDEVESVKRLAELEAIEALRKLADSAGLAGKSLESFGVEKIRTLNTKIDTYIEDMAISIIRELNARIAAMLAKFNFTSPTGGSGASDGGGGGGGNIIYSSAVQKFAIESTAKLNDKIQDYLAGFGMGGVQRSSSQSPMDIKITVDAGGDRMSQAIAESIQVATRSGYSTVPAGFLV
jgi:hypothetical protein